MSTESLQKMVAECTVVILDIEGTISSVSYWRKIAYPYIEEYIDLYIEKEFDEINNTLPRLVEAVPKSNEIEERKRCQKLLISYIKDQIKKKTNDPLLKTIKGIALRSAFKNGNLLGQIYPDAVSALEALSENKRIFIYSTGNKENQIEYFKHTSMGDMSKFIEDYFDTSIGDKTDSDGFKYICSRFKLNPNEVVFFSDRPTEIYAAKKGGLKAVLVDRKDEEISLINEEKELLGHEDGIISSFSDILPNIENV